MQVHMYVVQHDKGFAPNPFWGVCTLACCKPRIRKRAHLGDVVLGFGSASKEVDLAGRVIYWMTVDDIITFDDYWRDPRFATKRPAMGSGLMACYGDNIYHRDEVTGGWRQEYSFHADGDGLGRGNLERDTGMTDRVLIGRSFAYWGGTGPAFPQALHHLIPTYQAERCHFSDEEKADILAWIRSIQEHGFRGAPADWSRDHAKLPASRDASASRIREV